MGSLNSFAALFRPWTMRVLAVALSFACLAIDYETGPVIEFLVVYLAARITEHRYEALFDRR